MSMTPLEYSHNARRFFRHVRTTKVANGYTVNVWENQHGGSFSWDSVVVKRGRTYRAFNAQTFDTALAAEVAAVSALRNAKG
jgi:hypothetical protein